MGDRVAVADSAKGLFRPLVTCDPRGETAERCGRVIQDERDRVNRERGCLAQSEEDRRNALLLLDQHDGRLYAGIFVL
jgi:hypothetical protein